MLRTKCILLPRTAEDGYRISVMSRHALEYGVAPDARITEDSFDSWRKALAPPDRLVSDYYKRGMSWAVFEDRFRDYLQNAEQQRELQMLARYANALPTTILCIEQTPEQCHRRIIAEECGRLWKGLEIRVG